MAMAILSQPDCLTAWVNACLQVNGCPGHEAHDVMIEIIDPVLGTEASHPGIMIVDDFLTERAKPIATVANTIFPQATFERHGSPAFYSVFASLLAKLRTGDNWSGYYFERMTTHERYDGSLSNPLQDIIERLSNPKVTSKNKFELPIFDLDRDVNMSPYGGQCLSHLSFKVVSGDKNSLNLTCVYRNHHYIKKLLGNLIGLGRLQKFVAEQAGLDVGSLVIVSTHAEIDKPASAKQSEVNSLINEVAALIS